MTLVSHRRNLRTWLRLPPRTTQDGTDPGRSAALAGTGKAGAEWWGYVLWGAVGLVIAIPEIAAAAWHGGPWPTISGTIGHLEVIWSGTAIIVVAVVVAVAMHVLRYRPDNPTMGVIRPMTGLRRTQSGRLTKRPTRPQPP